MIYSGIDEAGLGPILGPFCATRVTMESQSTIEPITNKVQKKLFNVTDSKIVYRGRNGFKKLELNVLSFFYLLNRTIPKNSLEFMPTLKTEWYLNPLPLPYSVTEDEIIEHSSKIGEFFHSHEIKFIDIKRSAVSAKEFNTLLDYWGNKAVACQQIITPLLTSGLNIKGTHSVIVDKQGGRKFYKEYLENLTKKEITILEETQTHSIYQIGNIHVNFLAKADSLSFPVSLASMFSKYMRELAMITFNNYWQRKYPELKRTAGYYTDGVRYIEELKKRQLLPKDIDILIRKK